MRAVVTKSEQNSAIDVAQCEANQSEFYRVLPSSKNYLSRLNDTPVIFNAKLSCSCPTRLNNHFLHKIFRCVITLM